MKKPWQDMRKKFEAKKKEVQDKLVAGDGDAWHSVIMSVVVGFAGMVLIMGVIAQGVIEHQRESFRNSAWQVEQTHKLPPGDYRIFSIQPSGDGGPDFYLVSPADGGVLASIQAPDGTKPSTAAILHVSDDGKWSFRKTE